MALAWASAEVAWPLALVGRAAGAVATSSPRVARALAVGRPGRRLAAPREAYRVTRRPRRATLFPFFPTAVPTMSSPVPRRRPIDIVRDELRLLVTIKPSDRPWQMPFAAALANGLPLFVGAYFGHLEYGLISSLGGLAFLYLPDTPMAHRMVSLMAAAFGMIASYALGVMSHLVPALMTPVLTFIAILVTMVCRFYRVGVPGSLFFIMAAAIGAYTPGDVMQIPLKVGLLSMGSLLACLIAFFYSLFILSRRAPRPVEPLPPATFDFVIFDSLVIGLAVGLSLAAAQLLQLDNAYWVPVSCLAVIQGMSLRAVWDKQVQRLLGTAIGLGVSWLLLSLPLDAWRIAAVITALAFIVETAVVRHYGFAAIFITPLTLLLAEAGKVGQIDPGVLIKARFIDTLLGCALGLAGGVCLHTPRIREALSRPLRRLFNARPT